MKPQKSEALWNQVLDELLAAITEMAPGENQLPAEVDLAKQLQVSRATIREALQVLSSGGYLSRRHGKGNFAHPSTGRLKHRIDQNWDFARLVSREGAMGAYEVVRSGYAPAHPAMARDFPNCNQRFFEQFWLYKLGDTNMVYCKNYVPEDLLVTPPRPPRAQQRLTDWLAEYCRQDVAHYSVRMGCQADADANWTFGLPAGTVTLNWQETVYSIHDLPMAFCDVYFHPENIDLSMIMKV